MKTNNNRKGLFIFLIAGLLFFSLPAFATGPAFTGLAAKADSAETVMLNPAGMARLNNPAWFGNPQVMYTDNSTEFAVGGQNVGSTIDDDGVIFLPGIYYVRPLNDKWSIGIGPSGATGLGYIYNDSWAGRYLIKEWSLVFIGVMPSVAYRVNENLSIGGSLSINYSEFTLEKAVFNGIGQPDGHFELEADGLGIGGTVGLLYEFNPLTRIGVVYRSEVEAEDEGTPKFSNLSAARQLLLDNAGVLNQKISMDTNTPQSIMAGVFHDFDNRWTMTVDALWLDFSNFNIDNISIGETSISKGSSKYKDMWGVSLGTTYELEPDWSLRAGTMYVSPGLDDKDRTIFSRYDAMWAVGAGVEHELKSKRKVAVDITYLYFGDGEFTSSDVPVVGVINGEYDTHYGVMLSVGTSF